MYAVIRTGGKQYRVAPGDILEVEKLAGSVGDTVVLEDVLLVNTDDDVKVGQPNVSGASVTAKITGQHRGEKILVFRYRPKKRIRVRRGHRQYLTRLEIQSISGDGFELVAPIKEAVAPVVEAVAEIAQEVIEPFTEEVAGEDSATEEIVEAGIVEEVVEAAETAAETVQEIAADVAQAGSDAADAVVAVAESAVEAISDETDVEAGADDTDAEASASEEGSDESGSEQSGSEQNDSQEKQGE